MTGKDREQLWLLVQYLAQQQLPQSRDLVARLERYLQTEDAKVLKDVRKAA